MVHGSVLSPRWGRGELATAALAGGWWKVEPGAGGGKRVEAGFRTRVLRFSQPGRRGAL